MNKIQKIMTVGLGSALFFSCGGGKEHDGAHDHHADSTHVVPDTTKYTVDDTIKFKFDFTLANIPSPASTIEELKSYGVAYDKHILNETARIPSYPNEDKQALNLGVFNIDMTYAMSNNVGSDVIDFTKGTMMLVDKLGLKSAVSTMVGKRAENNMSNKDSIFKIIDEIFIKSDSYLRTNKRVKTAAVIFTGSWLEAIYLNSTLYSSIKDEALKVKARKQLWDQRFHLGNLIDLLKDFKSDGEMKMIVSDLTAIHDLIKSANGPTDLTEEKFNEITVKINDLRTRVVS